MLQLRRLNGRSLTLARFALHLCLTVAEAIVRLNPTHWRTKSVQAV